ncbi:hypothetical protein OCU04_006713 [Sclerotinia nivalis]|uniref:Uncharacterized protein n=1 Tax=Sclerotinia nivalis TaxID=352851 RepID=A0A9X0DIP0_9HELO|nr:hypothetical protein OCU04_006713 [Sclerotinia nivalis]
MDNSINQSCCQLPRSQSCRSGFLGDHVPNLNTTELYTPNDRQDFLVKSKRFDSALAERFFQAGINHSRLQCRRNGQTWFHNLGSSVRQARYRVVYTRQHKVCKQMFLCSEMSRQASIS